MSATATAEVILEEPVEMPSFNASGGQVPEEAVVSYERDGVVCLRSAIAPEWIEALAQGMDIAIEQGTENDKAFSIANPGEPGFFFYDTFMWQRIDQFKRFAFESNAADLAMQVMRSKSLIFYFDFMLVKEPGTSRKTPWHYDEAYWPVSGEQICNLWVAVDHIPIETALRFVSGSHQMRDKAYRSVHFDPNDAYGNPEPLPTPPDWDQIEGEHEIIYAPLEPGDILVFHSRTHHSAPGNSLKATRRRALASHWLGDDIRYNDKP
ncbi:MAG: phytanoyl-CoA dioxygenase family protein, partial [Rhodospirillaceae bacterium]|nr:phytanoyl-CoA dioxygenase family protein [Rhodospirillaceae bacterium]